MLVVFLPFFYMLHTIKAFSTRFPKRFPKKLPTAFSAAFPARFSCKIFLQDFPIRFSCKTFWQEFPTSFPARISEKIFRQDFPTRFSHKIFPQEFPANISHKIFLQDFPKLDPDWLAPHHPVANAKFPPIIGFLKLAFSPPPCPTRFSCKIFPSWILIGWLPITLFQMLNFHQSLLS